MRHRIVFLLCAVLVGGCGGSGNDAAPISPPPSGPTAVVFVSPPPGSLAVKASATVAAAAIFANSDTGGNTAVTWTLACGSAGACGSVGANDDAAAVTYTAPAVIPKGNTVTLTATSVANPSLSVSATITITAPIPIAVSFAANPPASIQASAKLSLSANIANDVSSDPQVTWTVTCSAAACGAFQPTTTAGGAITDFTAPMSVPTGGSVKITATSVTDSTKSVSATLVVTAAVATLANGTYVFQIAGPPGSQATFVTGVLVASNGRITGGEQDSIAYSTDTSGDAYGSPVFQSITGGSYATTIDGNLQVSIQLGANQSEILTGTLAGGTGGFVSSLNGTSSSGTLELQSSTEAPSGGYAISLFGGDGNQSPLWLAGVLNIDGPGSISGTGSILDVIDQGGPQSATYTLGSSSLTAPDAQGRVQITLQPSGNTLPALTLIGYIVDATHIRLIENGGSDDAPNYEGVLGGLALGQGSSTGQFSNSGVQGTNYVFAAQGVDSQGTLQIAGVLSLKANGAVTGTLNWNDLTGKTAQAPASFTGTYAVDPTGRVTLSSLTDGATFAYSLNLYLAAGGNALLLSNDSNDAFDGQGYKQQSAGLTAASFSGAYGLNVTQLSENAQASGLQQVATIGTVSAVVGGTGSVFNGFADSGDDAANFEVSGSVTAATSVTAGQNGVFAATLAGLDPGFPATPGSFTLYAIDGTHAVLIETDAEALTLGTLQTAP